MMTLEQIKFRMKHLKIKSLARECGVSAWILYRIVNDDDGSYKPLYETVERISKYFEQEDKKYANQ